MFIVLANTCTHYTIHCTFLLVIMALEQRTSYSHPLIRDMSQSPTLHLLPISKELKKSLSYESGTRTLLREEAVCENIPKLPRVDEPFRQDQNVRGWGWSACLKSDICFTLREEHEEKDREKRGTDDKRGTQMWRIHAKSLCETAKSSQHWRCWLCDQELCALLNFSSNLSIFLEVYYAFIKVYKAFNKKFWASEFCYFFKTVARLSLHFVFCDEKQK